MQAEDPAKEEKRPGVQGVHWVRAVAPDKAEAVPGGQDMHPLEVCPREGLKLPLGQGWQADRAVEAGRLLNVPVGQGVQEVVPLALV